LYASSVLPKCKSERWRIRVRGIDIFEDEGEVGVAVGAIAGFV
jgi:hypothetical protein